MIFDYLLRLLVLLPLVAGLAWGALYLWKRLGGGLIPQARDRRIRVVDGLPLGTAGRLALVEFDGRALLLSVSRAGITLVADGTAGQANPWDNKDDH